MKRHEVAKSKRCSYNTQNYFVTDSNCCVVQTSFGDPGLEAEYSLIFDLINVLAKSLARVIFLQSTSTQGRRDVRVNMRWCSDVCVTTHLFCPRKE